MIDDAERYKSQVTQLKQAVTLSTAYLWQHSNLCKREIKEESATTQRHILPASASVRTGNTRQLTNTHRVLYDFRFGDTLLLRLCRLPPFLLFPLPLIARNEVKVENKSITKTRTTSAPSPLRGGWGRPFGGSSRADLCAVNFAFIFARGIKEIVLINWLIV